MRCWFAILPLLFVHWTTIGQTNEFPWPNHPLTQTECLELALRQNPVVLKHQQDIAEAHGIALQTRSAYTPKVRLNAGYALDDQGKIESLSFPGIPPVSFRKDQNWNASVQLAQPIYTGGKLKSAARSAKLTEDAALAQHAVVVSETLLLVRTAYQDALLAQEQIGVHEASIELLERELKDTQRRFDAGAAPKFNVLRAEVELATSKPRLIHARNTARVSKDSLATVLGWRIPAELGEQIPLQLADHLQRQPFSLDLVAALGRAQRNRPELKVSQLSEHLRAEDIVQAKAGLLPQVQGISSYGVQNRVFTPSLADELHGWGLGAQVTWDIFDFGATKGRVKSAQARREKARLETDDVARRIELEVRIAHSTFSEAIEVLESQSKVIEQAEEALRLANARTDAGTGTQLDVLTAQTALTQTRTLYSQSLHDHNVALARLDKATGEMVSVQRPPH